MDNNLLLGKKVLIIGISNENSIAYGCAPMLKRSRANLAITYLNEKKKYYVDKLAEELQAILYERCDVTIENDLEDLFVKIRDKWDNVDIIHSLYCARSR